MSILRLSQMQTSDWMGLRRLCRNLKRQRVLPKTWSWMLGGTSVHRQWYVNEVPRWRYTMLTASCIQLDSSSKKNKLKRTLTLKMVCWTEVNGVPSSLPLRNGHVPVALAPSIVSALLIRMRTTGSLIYHLNSYKYVIPSPQDSSRTQ